jgi:hypothetical protein
MQKDDDNGDSKKENEIAAAAAEDERESVREGEAIELVCVVDANPKAKAILWMYEVRKEEDAKLGALHCK